MSEEKRFTNKKLIAVSIMLVLFIGATGVLGFMLISVNNDYTNLSGDYDDLYIDHLELLNDFSNLDNQYFILTGEHIELENDYNILAIGLADMTTERDDLLIQIDILNAEISVHLTTISGLNDQIGVLEAEIIVLDAEILVHLTTISDLNAQIGVLEAEIFVLEGQAVIDEQTIADLNAQIGALNTQITNLLTTISDLENTIDLRDATILDLNTQITNHLLTISGLETELTEMTGFRDALQFDLDTLNATYIALLDDYQILFDANADLQIIYDALLIAYDYICNTIKQSILPVQYSIFAEAVRRYYMPIYLEGLTGKGYWMAFAEFCRDIVLHDTQEYYNPFYDVSNAFSDALMYGIDTWLLTYNIMINVFEICDTINHWDSNYADDLVGIDAVVQDCINKIDYEYDSDITLEQETFNWDYIKFSVETAFRTKGDCEDQAILTAAYLESCGYETAIAISHDPAHPTLGEFYHGHLLVYIEDTSAFWNLYPTTGLWSVPVLEGLWCWLDTTWDVPFGSTPSWLQDYSDFGGLTTLVVTVAECNIGGAVGTNIGENLGLTCVRPN